MSNEKRIKVKHYMPGCYIETSRDDDTALWYERPENDEEYQKRTLKEKNREEVRDE